MKIELKSEFNISNQGGFSSNENDLMVQKTSTKIIVDITDRFIENFTEEECHEHFEKYLDGIMVEVGKIICSRLDFRYGEDNLFDCVDNDYPDLEPIFSYFIYGEGKKWLNDYWFADCLPNVIYYIDLVFIKPEHRGYNYGLYGLALFLEAVAKYAMVVCCPTPIDENGVPINRKDIDELTKEEINLLWPIPSLFYNIFYLSPEELEKAQERYREHKKLSFKIFFNEKEPKARKILARYWSKLGLNYYNQEENLLWTMEWQMPQWIREKLFDNNYY